MGEYRRDLAHWTWEASFIETEVGRFLQFGRMELADYNYDPACFRRYVEMHEELCRKDGFVDLANRIKTQLGRIDDAE